MTIKSIATRQLDIGPAGFFLVEPETPPGNQVVVRAGALFSGAYGVFHQASPQTSAGFAGVNPGQQRYDLVYLNSSGVVQTLAGTEIALGSPAFQRAPGWTGTNPGPQLPDNIVPLAWVFIDEPLPGAAVVDVSDITILGGFVQPHRNLNGYLIEKTNLGSAPTGTSSVVTALFAGESSGGSASQPGVVTTPPSNVVDILRHPSRDEILHSTGARVYGRLTFAAGTWTLSYFYLNSSGVETAVDISTVPSPPADILLAGVRKVFSDNDPLRPLFASQNGAVVSDQLVGDIPLATTSQAGKVELALSSETTAGLALQASDSRLPTQDENNALVGTSGTPSAGNPFVTNSDPRITALFTPAYYYGRFSSEAVNPYGDGLNRIVFATGVESAGISHSGANGAFTVTAAGRYEVHASIEFTTAAGGYDIHTPAGSYTPPTGAVAGASSGGAASGHMNMVAIINLAASGSFEIVENAAPPSVLPGFPHRTTVSIKRIA